ncbi:phage portal protein [candidate division WOR-3 bacterium]|nr:phage portal protein [candidate division WOR-3 bacterium]
MMVPTSELRILGLPVLRRYVRVEEMPTVRAFGSWESELQTFLEAYGVATPEQLRTVEHAYKNLSVVFRCVRILINSGTVQPEAVDAAGQPMKSAAFDSWVAEPCPGMTWEHWFGLVIAHITLSGGCRLVRLKPDSIQTMPYSLTACVVRQPQGLDQTYPAPQFALGQKLLPREQVIEIVPPDPTGLFDAVGPGEAAMLAAKTGWLAGLHSHNTLSNGAQIAAVLMLKRSFESPEQFQEFMTRFKDSFQKARRSGTIPVLDANLEGELKPLGMTVADLRLVELARASREEIGTAFGVPPALLGDSEARYANFKEQRITFLEDTLRPLWRLLQGRLNYGFAGQLGIPALRLREADSYVVRLLWQETATGLAPAVGRVMTVNEARVKLGLPPVQSGDVLEQPISVIPVPAEPKLPARTERHQALVSALAGALSKREPTVNGRPESTRVAYWRGFAQALSSLEEKFARDYEKVLTALRKALQDSAQAHWQQDGNVPFERKQFDVASMRVRMRMLPAAWRTGGQTGMAEAEDIAGKHAVGVDTRAFELSEATMELIRRRAEHWTEITGDVTFEAIDALLGRAVADGYTLQQVMTALEDAPMLMPARAERVARTEIIGSLNGGKLDGYRQAGLQQKEWLATKDDRVRDEHLEADGQTVPIAEAFEVGGERLDYPGDPGGDPGNIINCRCTVLPVVGGAE